MFNDLQQKTLVESGVIAAHKNLARLSLFSKSWSAVPGTPYASVAIPVYDISASNEFNSSTNNYANTEGIDGKLVTLDKHYVKSIGITDVQQATTGIQWVKDSAAALADSITRSVNQYVFSQVNATNCPLSAEADLSSTGGIAALYATAEANDIPVDRAVVVLSPANFALVLSQLPAQVYGGADAVRNAVIPGLFGFKGFLASSNISDMGGFIAADSAIGIASRAIYPGTEGAYPDFWTATDDDGWTLSYRRYMALDTGENILACDTLFGCAILQPSKIVRLVNAS